MIFSYRKWMARGRFLLLFMALTFCIYHVMLALTAWIQPTQKYKQPTGKSVKVFQQHASVSEKETMTERLRLFYWYGE
jgi:hypothetical protein